MTLHVGSDAQRRWLVSVMGEPLDEFIKRWEKTTATRRAPQQQATWQRGRIANNQSVRRTINKETEWIDQGFFTENGGQGEVQLNVLVSPNYPASCIPRMTVDRLGWEPFEWPMKIFQNPKGGQTAPTGAVSLLTSFDLLVPIFVKYLTVLLVLSFCWSHRLCTSANFGKHARN